MIHWIRIQFGFSPWRLIINVLINFLLAHVKLSYESFINILLNTHKRLTSHPRHYGYWHVSVKKQIIYSLQILAPPSPSREEPKLGNFLENEKLNKAWQVDNVDADGFCDKCGIIDMLHVSRRQTLYLAGNLENIWCKFLNKVFFQKNSSGFHGMS